MVKKILIIAGILSVLGITGYFVFRIDTIDLEFSKESVNERDFYWSNRDNEYLKAFREEYNLDYIIKEAETDFEKTKLLNSWVNGLWSHHGSNIPEKNDPISILKEVEEGKRFRCVEYSIVLTGALNAVGIPARILALKTSDVETRESGAGHVVTEAYIKDLEKWIMLDGQWNAIPTLNNIPLNAVEFQRALNNDYSEIKILNLGFARSITYKNWVYQYLFYFDVAYDNRYIDEKDNLRLMLIPKDSPEPKVFQIKHPIGNMVYTNSLIDFYPNPFEYID